MERPLFLIPRFGKFLCGEKMTTEQLPLKANREDHGHRESRKNVDPKHIVIGVWSFFLCWMTDTVCAGFSLHIED